MIRTTALLAIICLCLLSCTQFSVEEVKPLTASEKLAKAVAENKDSLALLEKIKIENTTVGFDMPIAFASTKNIAIPLLFDQDVDKGVSETTYYNLLVISPGDSLGRLVFAQSDVIESITTFEKRKQIDVEDFYYDEDERMFSDDFNSMLFLVMRKATGEYKPYKVLYAYNLANEQLSQLSPDNYNLESWYPIDGTSTLVINCQSDDNRDNRFDIKDDSKIFLADFKKGASSIEMKVDTYKLKEIKKTLKDTYE